MLLIYIKYKCFLKKKIYKDNSELINQRVCEKYQTSVYYGYARI